MNLIPVDNNPTADEASCRTDQSCATEPDSSCGCGPTTERAGRPAAKRGIVGALLIAACAAACLAVPLAVGGAAAVSGALAGEWWVAVVALAATAIGAGVVLKCRNRAGGSVC